MVTVVFLTRDIRQLITCISSVFSSLESDAQAYLYPRQRALYLMSRRLSCYSCEERAAAVLAVVILPPL